MATRPPRAVTGCRHGSLMVEQDREAAVEGYVERLGEVCQEFLLKFQSGDELLHELDGHREDLMQANFELLEQFWSEPKHAGFVDAKMVRFCFAYATEAALEGQLQLSCRLAHLGIHLATWFKLGKDIFLDVLSGTPAESSANIQTVLEFQASMVKIGTARGLVFFLSKQIPCSCLDEDKKSAKQVPKSGRCNHCSSEVLKLELKKCSRCKSNQYCSKKCQVADWRAGHKEDCEMIKLWHEQEAAFKAQTHRRKTSKSAFD